MWEEVWSQWNQAWLQKPTLSPFQLFLQSATNMRSFRGVQASVNHHLSTKLSLWDRWEVSLPEVCKVNMDGATFEEDNTYGVGIVIPD